MSLSSRIPHSIGEIAGVDADGYLFWMEEIGDDWTEVITELSEAFEVARERARSESSFIFVVRNDDLLGRNGAGRAMAAAGLVSAARTAALEGAGKDWTANVIAIDSAVVPDQVLAVARFVLASGATTGEVIHLGPGHIGKALV